MLSSIPPVFPILKQFKIKNWILLINNIRKVYDQLVEMKAIVPKPEQAPPSVPMDYDWARVWVLNFLNFESINIKVNHLPK